VFTVVRLAVEALAVEDMLLRFFFASKVAAVGDFFCSVEDLLIDLLLTERSGSSVGIR
jgi:hypothetical protein